MVEIPANDAVELPLPIPAAFNGGTSHVDRCISVQPLLSHHCQESGEERSGKTGKEDRLDLDNHVWRSSPRLWDGGHVITESCVVHLVDEDTEEGGGLFIWIGLGVDLDNEGGSDGGEQTSL